MLQNPLKKNKHSYPIDFSNRKKDPHRQLTKKYQRIADQQNPERNPKQSQTSASLYKSSASEPFVHSYRKHNQNKSINQNKSPQFLLSKQTNIISPSNQQNQRHQNQFSGIDPQENQQPLRQVRKKQKRFMIDESKLRNPRIQFHEGKTMKISQKTLQTISSQVTQKNKKAPQAGGIKHQDLKYIQKSQGLKQTPLSPQKPFEILNKNLRRNSLLDKLRINKFKQTPLKSQFYSCINSQMTSGNKMFHPQTYSYQNVMMVPQLNVHREQDFRKVNSSYDIQKRQNILYLNRSDNNESSFNLPDLPVEDSINKFKNVSSQNSFSLKSRFSNRQRIGQLFSKNSRFLFSHSEQNHQKVKFQPSQMNKLKAQINLLTQNRFRNRASNYNRQGDVERQFTFQDDLKNNKFNQTERVSCKKRATKKLEITFHVPLAALKGICRKYISCSEEYILSFKVPKVFMDKKLFPRNQPKDQLHQNSLLLFQSLNISSKNMVIKRYSNCIMFISGHVVVMWHFSGKRYLGGWQYEYLDEGSKHGLGLEWEPERSIYYGEFRDNKRHGLGALKQGPEQVTVGYWLTGKYIGTTFKQQQQEWENQENQSSQLLNQQNYQNFDEDQQYQE